VIEKKLKSGKILCRSCLFIFAMGIPTGLSVATKNEAKKGLPRKTRLPAQTY
jgi:hypothetical protein